MTISNRDLPLLVIFGALLVSLGAWFWWLTPTATALKTGMAQAQTLGQQETVLSQRKALLANVSQQLSSNEDAARLIQLAAPQDQSMDALLVSFAAMAEQSGVTLASVQPQAAGQVPQELMTVIGVNGTFGGIQAFVQAIERNLRPLTIHSLTLTGGTSAAGSTIVNATLTVGALNLEVQAPTAKETP
jgi:Tfp pilus assembly protein PilO